MWLSAILFVCAFLFECTHAGSFAAKLSRHSADSAGRFDGVEKTFKKENFINFEKECIIAERELIERDPHEYKDYMGQLIDQLSEPHAQTILSRYSDLSLNDSLDYSMMELEEHWGIFKACNSFNQYYIPVYGVRNFERILKPYCKSIKEASTAPEVRPSSVSAIEGRAKAKKKDKKKKKKLTKKQRIEKLKKQIQNQVKKLDKLLNPKGKKKGKVGNNIISHHHDGLDHPGSDGVHLDAMVTIPSFEVDVLKFERNGFRYKGGRYERKFASEMSKGEVLGIQSLCHKYASHISIGHLDEDTDLEWKKTELKDDLMFMDIMA